MWLQLPSPSIQRAVCVMASRLRGVAGGWVNVDVEFAQDWPAPFLNHLRIAAKPVLGTMGLPVVAYLAEQVFVL
jgi:hypothetical protein